MLICIYKVHFIFNDCIFNQILEVVRKKEKYNLSTLRWTNTWSWMIYMTQEQRRVHRNRISQTETNTVMLSSSWDETWTRRQKSSRNKRNKNTRNRGSQCMARPGAGARAVCDQSPSQSQSTPELGSSNEVITLPSIVMWIVTIVSMSSSHY